MSWRIPVASCIAFAAVALNGLVLGLRKAAHEQHDSTPQASDTNHSETVSRLGALSRKLASLHSRATELARLESEQAQKAASAVPAGAEELLAELEAEVRLLEDTCRKVLRDAIREHDRDRKSSNALSGGLQSPAQDAQATATQQALFMNGAMPLSERVRALRHITRLRSDAALAPLLAELRSLLLTTQDPQQLESLVDAIDGVNEPTVISALVNAIAGCQDDGVRLETVRLLRKVTYHPEAVHGLELISVGPNGRASRAAKAALDAYYHTLAHPTED